MILLPPPKIVRGGEPAHDDNVPILELPHLPDFGGSNLGFCLPVGTYVVGTYLGFRLGRIFIAMVTGEGREASSNAVAARVPRLAPVSQRLGGGGGLSVSGVGGSVNHSSIITATFLSYFPEGQDEVLQNCPGGKHTQLALEFANPRVVEGTHGVQNSTVH